MTSTESSQEREKRLRRHIRIRRAKQILRPLPRRANLHRYPVIKWFASYARKQPHLWSFRVQNVSPAIYAGCILAFLPAYGVQLPLAFLASIIFRGNVLVCSALVFITNPVTLIPVYLFTHKVGKWLIELWHLGEAQSLIGAKAYPLVVGGFLVGLISALALDLIYRFLVHRRARKSVNVKRMLKN